MGHTHILVLFSWHSADEMEEKTDVKKSGVDAFYRWFCRFDKVANICDMLQITVCVLETSLLVVRRSQQFTSLST